MIIYAAFCVSGFSVSFLAGQQAFGKITTSDISRSHNCGDWWYQQAVVRLGWRFCL